MNAELNVEVRASDDPRPLPEGWITHSCRWNGQMAQVAYDPGRLQVARMGADVLDNECRRTLGETGWHHLATDSGGSELWVADRDRTRLARLDRLAVQQPHLDAPGLSLG